MHGSCAAFLLQEYRRAAHVLADAQGGKSLFLRCYAMYLAGEKRKQCATTKFPGNLVAALSMRRAYWLLRLCIRQAHPLQGGAG